MKSPNPEDRFPCWTEFIIQYDAPTFREALGLFLRLRAQEGWFVEAEDPEEPSTGRVFHVNPDDLPAPPPGIMTILHQKKSDYSEGSDGGGTSAPGGSSSK